MVPLSHPYMTTGKTIALTRQTFVSNVSVFFNICCLGLSTESVVKVILIPDSKSFSIDNGENLMMGNVRNAKSFSDFPSHSSWRP